MKLFYIVIIFILEIYNSKGKEEIKNFLNISKANVQINNISNKVNEILNLDKEINDLLIETNSTLNQLNNKSKNLNQKLMQIKWLNSGQNNYLRNFIVCFCLIIFLALLIYILESKYQNQIKKNKRNVSINSRSLNNNISNKQGVDTKIYFSL